MAPSAPVEENVSRIAFWPLWAAGRFVTSMLYLSMFALTITVMLAHFKVNMSVDGMARYWKKYRAERAGSDHA